MILEIEIADKNVQDVLDALGLAGQVGILNYTAKDVLEQHFSDQIYRAVYERVSAQKKADIDAVIATVIQPGDVKPANK